MRGGFKSVLRCLTLYSLLLCISLLCLLVYDVITSLFEIRYVATGSMEPYFPRGSIIVLHKDYGGLAIGDSIVYSYAHSPSTLLFHRIVDINNTYIYVKGDATTTVERVELKNVAGVYVFGIPYIVEILKTLILNPFLIFFLVILLFLFSMKENR